MLDSVRGVARPNPGRVDFAQQHQLRIASHVPALHHSRTGVRRRGHRSLREKLQLGQTLAEHLPTDPKSADSRQQPTTANSQQQPTADNSQQPTTANSQQPTTADNSQQQPTTANSRQPTTADSRQQPTAHRQGHKPGNQQKRRKNRNRDKHGEPGDTPTRHTSKCRRHRLQRRSAPQRAPRIPLARPFQLRFFCQGKGANRRKTCKDAKRRRYTGGFGAPIFCIHMNYTWIPIFVLNHPIQQQ